MFLMIFLLFLILLRPYCTLTTISSPVALETPGILQLTWLFGPEPTISRVHVLETTLLRCAGMFNVDMGTILAQKTKSVKNAEIVSVDGEEGFDEFVGGKNFHDHSEIHPLLDIVFFRLRNCMTVVPS